MEKSIEEKVEEALELARENNKMLHKMRRAQIYSSIWRVTYWILIIAASIGTYYYLQPYIEGVRALYENVSDQAQSVSNFFGGGNKEN